MDCYLETLFQTKRELSISLTFKDITPVKLSFALFVIFHVMIAMLPMNSERKTVLKVIMCKHHEKAKMQKQLEINALTRKRGPWTMIIP